MRIYLDHAATTPMREEVLDAYSSALRGTGNPSSIHSDGQRARAVLEESRERLATVLGCDPIEVILTSGGTEAINMAIKGLYWARAAVGSGRGARILLPGGEHHATVDTVAWLALHAGAVVDELPLDALGRLSPRVLDDALASRGDSATPAALVTALWANNEIGTLQEVPELAAIAAGRGVPLHVDAVAAFGSVPVDFRASGATALSISAHKIGGPVGVGALVLSRAATIEPLLHGGGQQRNVRSGTQDVAGAVAFAVAAELAHAELEQSSRRLTALRDRLIAGVRSAVPQAVLSGDEHGRLPGNVHFTFPGCEGDSLLFLLDAAGLSVSTGSACQAGVPEVSHVLLALGLSEERARGALRFSLGRSSTEADVDALVAALPEAYARASQAGHSSRTPPPR